jgi:DNA-binding transcriptional LysR family regulator
MPDIDGIDFDLNLLVVLDSLLEHKSVSSAARALGLTQPTISHSLARLREAFSDPLLVRAGRNMMLTPRAEALAPSVKAVLQDVRRVLSLSVHFDPELTTRTFTLGCPDLFVAFLPELLGRLSREAPGLRVVAVPPPLDLGEALSQGIIDLAVTGSQIEGAGLVQRHLASMTWVVLARHGHPGVHGDRIDMETWLKYPHVIVQRPGPLAEILAALGHERKVAFTAPNFLSAPYAVAHTDWFFTMPRELVRRQAQDLRLQMLEPPLPMPALRVVSAWHERLSADPGHAWLRQRIVETANRALEETTAPKVVPNKRSG